jgi:hypothetical protein
MSRRTSKRQRFYATGSARVNLRRVAKRGLRRWGVGRLGEWEAMLFDALVHGKGVMADGSRADPEKFGVIAVDAP